MRQWFGRKIHESWVVAWFCVELIGGIAATFWVRATPDVLWLVVAAALLFLALAKRTVGMVVLAVIAGLLLGFWRGENVQMGTAGYQKFVGQTVHLSGTIAADTTRKGGQTGLEISGVHVENDKLSGKVWVGTTAKLALQRGDHVAVVGKLAPGFGNFAASMSFAHVQGVAHPQTTNLFLSIRDSFANGLRRAVPEPQAALGLGYL